MDMDMDAVREMTMDIDMGRDTGHGHRIRLKTTQCYGRACTSALMIKFKNIKKEICT